MSSANPSYGHDVANTVKYMRHHLWKYLLIYNKFQQVYCNWAKKPRYGRRVVPLYQLFFTKVFASFFRTALDSCNYKHHVYYLYATCISFCIVQTPRSRSWYIRNREYWRMYRGLGFLAVVWFVLHARPLPPHLPSVSSTSDAHKDQEKVITWWREGGWT